MATAQNVIDEIQQFFPDVGETRVLQVLQKADTHIRQQVFLLEDTESIASVADTREYALDTDILRIWSVRYQESSTATIKYLEPTSVAELDLTMPTWRNVDSSDPTHFYHRGTKVGFYPAPDTTQSAGYPAITLEVARSVTLIANSTMAANVPSHDAWLYGSCRELAIQEEDARYPMFHERAETKLNELRAFVHGINARYNPTLRPAPVYGRVKRV